MTMSDVEDANDPPPSAGQEDTVPPTDDGDENMSQSDNGAAPDENANEDTNKNTDMDVDDKEEGEEDSQKNDVDDPTPTPTPTPPSDDVTVFGGPLPDEKKPAFALLAGIYEDSKKKEGPNPLRKELSVPVTILPAILGRTSHGGGDKQKHMIDLGNCKQLSRKHAVIFYCDVYGGTLGNDGGKHPPPGIGGDKADASSSFNPAKDVFKIDNEWSYRYPPTPRNPNRPFSGSKRKELPQEGFFAIECLSKNKIIVDGKRIDQGKVAPLHHKSTIKMLTYTLYFLLPEDANSTSKTVNVPHVIQENEGNDQGGGKAGGKDAEEDGNVIGSPSPMKKVKKENEWEGKPVTKLLHEFNSAVENDNFDRKASMISTQILQHAVEDGSRDAHLREMCEKENGISRHLLIEWIANSDLYGNYVNNLLTKLEVKSYQQNLSKAMIKSGYKRIGNAGRHIKWLLPEVDSDEDMEGETNPNSNNDADTETNHTDTNANANDAAGTDLEVKKEMLENATVDDTEKGDEDAVEEREGDNVEDEGKSSVKEDNSQAPSEHESEEGQDASDDEEDDPKKESDDDSSSRQHEASDN